MTARNRNRVLMIVENLPLPFDRRVWQEASALKSEGYQVSIICPTGVGYEKRHEVIDDIHIYRHRIPIEANSSLGYAVEYACALACEFYLSVKILLTRGFDIVHACNPPDLIFVIGGFFRIFGKKFIFDQHDIGPELYEAKFGRRGFAYRLLGFLERMSFSVADVSIATNESYRDIAIKRGGMDPTRVFVVRSGPDLERFKPVAPVESLKKGKPHLVGYVGVMGAQEGIDHLLRAINHIVHQRARRDFHFGLVGGGPELPRLKKLAEELCVDEYVTFTGRIPDQNLLEMLSTADICVNPDVPNEMNDKSTMNKIMEYMALSKPIVQYDLQEGKVSAGEASLYAAPNDTVDFGNKIVQLADDPELRAKMGRCGYERVNTQLQWCHQAPSLISAYELLARS